MKIKNATLIILILVLANFSASTQTFETSKGKVEFIGMEKWTPQLGTWLTKSDSSRFFDLFNDSENSFIKHTLFA